MKKLTPEQAFQKAKHYCAYQERSHKEVKDKLYSFGLWKNEVENLLTKLIEEDYLNEERFARAFAGGKFRMKQWGKMKIVYELKQRQVSEYNIRKSMKEITDQDYVETFDRLLEKKTLELKGEKNHFTKKKKLLDYLMQKGYERDLIMMRLNEQS